MIQLIPLAASVFAAWSVQPITPPTEGGAGLRSGQGFAIEDEWAEELPPLTSDSGGLRTRVDLGRAPGQSATRISLEGVEPMTSVCLELGTLRGTHLAQRARQMLLSDAEGRTSITLPGPVPFGLGVRFTARPAGGSILTTTAVGLPNTPPLPLVTFQRGDVVIMEIMKDPTFVSDAHGEWFEIQNITNRTINIAGWKISDLGTNAHTLSNNGQPIFLLPGQLYVLGNDKDPLTNGGVNVDYKYSNFTLGNGADSILLTSRSGILVDEVDYDAGIFWPNVPGKSITLHPFTGDVMLNDDPANWCPAKALIGGGNTDLGTPGLFNDTCP